MMAYASTLLLLMASVGTESPDAATHTVRWGAENRVQWALAEANWRLRHGTPANEVEAWLHTQLPDESGTKPLPMWNAYKQAIRYPMDPSPPLPPIAADSAPMPAAEERTPDIHALPKRP